MTETVVVAGSLAQRAHHGGHAWVFLQYLLGFKQLGWDVVFLDRLEPEMCTDAAGAPVPVEASANLRYLVDVLERFGLGDSWAVLSDGGRQVVGMERRDLLERVRRSAFLLNVMGFIDDDDVLAAAPLRVFLDIDPGFGQMWQDLRLHTLFQGHDRYVTIGENIGSPECHIPTLGIDWITTKQPVVLDEWPVVASPGGRFTSVASWRGPFGPIEYQGRTYGLRVHEFRRFFDLPARTGAPFEVALDIHEAEVDDLRRLDESGWTLADPRVVAADPWAYRRYIAGSAAELMIAKNLYVQARTGWFSDRSACYLASGRPVVAQDTGLEGLVPTGEGLVTFSTVDDAAEAVAAVLAEPARHGAAARAIAEEHFESSRVLSRLADRIAP